MIFSKIGAALISAPLLFACSGKTAAPAADTPADSAYNEIAVFNGDSAFRHVAVQVDFGPRVPGSDAHNECAQYIIGTLQRYGMDTVYTQTFDAEAYTGDVLPLTNIIAKYNASAPRRLLLAAHWDTRPWGDHELAGEARELPIPGANDGGSGVGVLLEVARVLSETPAGAEVGVDFIFFDGEDYGKSAGWGNDEDTWCLGSQHWAANSPYAGGTKPEYAVVLDMVGGKNARFYREITSEEHAKNVLDKVWNVAKRSGMGKRFINSTTGRIIDDHEQINKAGIPAIVIIESNHPRTHSFNPTWHTQSDNMSNLDRNTMKDVGQTVLNLIYEEGSAAK